MSLNNMDKRLWSWWINFDTKEALPNTWQDGDQIEIDYQGWKTITGPHKSEICCFGSTTQYRGDHWFQFDGVDIVDKGVRPKYIGTCLEPPLSKPNKPWHWLFPKHHF